MICRHELSAREKKQLLESRSRWRWGFEVVVKRCSECGSTKKRLRTFKSREAALRAAKKLGIKARSVFSWYQYPPDRIVTTAKKRKPKNATRSSRR